MEIIESFKTLVSLFESFSTSLFILEYFLHTSLLSCKKNATLEKVCQDFSCQASRFQGDLLRKVGWGRDWVPRRE